MKNKPSAEDKAESTTEKRTQGKNISSKIEEASSLLNDIENIYKAEIWQERLGNAINIIENIIPDDLDTDDKHVYFSVKGRIAFLCEQYDVAKLLIKEAGKHKKTKELKQFLRSIDDHSTRSSRLNVKYDSRWSLNQVRIIHEILGKSLNSHNTEFLPQNDFYDNWYGRSEDLQAMAGKLFEWLGVDVIPGSVIDFLNIEPPGLFFISEDNNEHILVNQIHRNDPYICGAILAHEIIHLYFNRHGVRLLVREDNERLTDVASMDAGFGALIINGMSHQTYWLITIIAALFGRIYFSSQSLTFGYFKGSEYARLYIERVKRRGHDLKITLKHIMPPAYAFLPISKLMIAIGRSPNALINKARNKHAAIFSLQLVIAIVAIVIGYRIYFSDGSLNSTVSPETTNQISQLRAQYDSCITILNGKKVELDNINTRMDQAERNGDRQLYNSLVSPQNLSVSIYNEKVDECESLRVQYNNLVK